MGKYKVFQSSWARNLLISIGAFWLSRLFVVPMSLLVGRLGNGLIYGDSIPAAIAMGIMVSNGRALCSAFGAVIVTLTVNSTKPQRWAWIVALLYALAAQPHFHWHRPPMMWDRVSQMANVLWPAVVCMVTGNLISKFLLKSELVSSTEPVDSSS